MKNPSTDALDEEIAEKLYNKSMELVRPFMRLEIPEAE